MLDVLDEPTAAALAYSLQPPRPLHGAPPTPPLLPDESRTVLVYDLGGGTFDVTLVRLSKQRFEALAIEGDARLGGKDWDDVLVNHVAARFKAQHGSDPRDDALSLTNLRAAAERAKRTLSKLPQASITCTHAGKTLSVPVTRAEFENLSRHLIFRTRALTQAVLRQAGVGWEQVERVLLVGGSTHMPMTSQMLAELSGRQPDNSLAVSEVVARGAALHAGIVAAHREQDRDALDPEAMDLLGQLVEVNVNAHSLGVEVRNAQEQKVNDVLIPKNTQLPTAASRVYYTKTENQPRVRVKVLQGEASEAENCAGVGECWIEGLPANLPARSPIQVRCGVASNGLIDVLALDMTSGKMARAVIHRASGLTDEEVAAEAAFVRSLKVQ